MIDFLKILLCPRFFMWSLSLKLFVKEEEITILWKMYMDVNFSFDYKNVSLLLMALKNVKNNYFLLPFSYYFIIELHNIVRHNYVRYFCSLLFVVCKSIVTWRWIMIPMKGMLLFLNWLAYFYHKFNFWSLTLLFFKISNLINTIFKNNYHS